MSRAGLFYDALIRQEGATARGLAFASASSQHLRFCALLAAVPIDAADGILDVGCGFADLHHFLRDVGHEGPYEGWDVSALALDEARHRAPELASRLRLRDAFDDAELTGDALLTDWVVCSGTFNVGCSEEDGMAALAPLFERARKGLVVTWQNDYGTHSPAPRDGYSRAKYRPETVFSHAKTLTPWVVLRDDYLPHDFLVALLRRPHWDLRAGSTRLLT